MKILWVVYTIFPDLSIALGKETPVGGGWMYGLANDLVNSGVKLTVVTARPNIEKHHCIINNINYYLLNGEKNIEEYDKSLEPQWKNIIKEVQPDVVHIHGTEYAPGLALIHACPNLDYVISIQGMTSVYSRYYLGGISLIDILKNYTLRDFIRWDSILQGQKKFRKRGDNIEIPYIKKALHIIGRTQWDHDHVKSINPDCTYHFCNESLRDSFYTSHKWQFDNKHEHSIFLSQAGYPLKGLHKVIEAVHLIKKIFPNIHIRVARNNITQSDSLMDKLRIKGYGKYIKTLIKKYKLNDNISFTGSLNESQMIEEYLKCHVFICPSSIENSPNSLGEAQLLGVPCIASYTGGVPDMVDHNETGLLYRFEEVEMLAQSIVRLFNNDQLATNISKKSIIAASKRHDREVNVNQLMEIYKQINLDTKKGLNYLH